MTFKEQIIASCIGTFFGFIFAIVLFFITNFIQQLLVKISFRAYLKREFKYNISLLKEWIDEIDKVLRKITAEDKQVYSYLKYSFFQRYFMQESFKLGIMYKLFDNEDIFSLNKVLLHCDIGMEQYVNSLIDRWKKGEIKRQEALDAFEFQKEELKEYKKHLEKLLSVIKSKKITF